MPLPFALDLFRLGLDSAVSFEDFSGPRHQVIRNRAPLLRWQLREAPLEAVLVIRAGDKHAELDADQLGRADRWIDRCCAPARDRRAAYPSPRSW